MKLKLMAGLLVALSFSTTAYSQSLEDAVRFIYCGDKGWAQCNMSAEIDNCSVSISSKAFVGIFYRLHFDKVIWSSAMIDRLSQNITASCSGECMEDPDGNFAKLVEIANPEAFLDNGRKVDLTKLSMGFTEAPDRVINAAQTIISHCPGVQSAF